jgi:hypothetical protein
MLRPREVAVLMLLLIRPRASFAQIGAILGLSKSAAHQAVTRLRRAGLLFAPERGVFLVARGPAREFVLFGLPYAMYPEEVARARGVPTGLLAVDDHEPESIADPRVLVWPSPLGTVVGRGLKPLFAGAPETPGREPRLYRLLALVDALRAGDVRERARARQLLEAEFAAPAPAL